MIGCDKDVDFVGYGVGMCGECLLESEHVFIFFNEIESWDFCPAVLVLDGSSCACTSIEWL